jgi:dipeptidyl aminopeptidase/acylaminoacyl peptidase
MKPSFEHLTTSMQKITLDTDLLNHIDEEERTRTKKKSELIHAVTFSYEVKGLRYDGFSVRPKHINGKKCPVIIFNRGGTGMFGSIKYGMLFMGMIAEFARAGYIVIGSQCMGFGEDGAPDEMGGEDFHSVLALKNLIDADESADSHAIGIYGASRGGMTTYRLLAETNWARAAIVVSGIVDMPGDVFFRPEMIEHYNKTFGGSEADLKKRSVWYWPERLPKDIPILIMHGSADWRVDPKTSIRLSEKLISLEIPHRLVIFEGNDHSLSENATEALEMKLAWMEKFVKNQAPLPILKKHGK